MMEKYGNVNNKQKKGRTDQRREILLGTYQAWLFDMGDKDRPQPELVRGVPLIKEEDTGDLFTSLRFTLPPEVTGGKNQLIEENHNLSKWFGKNNRKFEVDDDDCLLNAELPLCTPDGEAGIMLFIRPPGSCGIRIHKEAGENPPISSNELRTATCYIEKRYLDSEQEREDHKKALNKGNCFWLPGPDGEGLLRKGVRVAFPLFKNDEARRLKRPHEHVVLMQRGRLITKGEHQISIPTKIEVMSQYRKDQKVPNWYEIQVDHLGEITVINIRSEAHPWMQEAMRILTEEQDEEASRIEALQQGI